ncbi:hypothetical protein [Streptomyces sp. NPDC051162]|uniref:hypothetical protein n=1 Tax=Streptomyces sp. NPDC051162 TaxID=3154747 RepID=UPI003437F82C
MAAPIRVHRPTAGGGRRVTVRRHGVDHPLGMAYRDADVVEFLRRAGMADVGEEVLDDAESVGWEGAGPHEWPAA